MRNHDSGNLIWVQSDGGPLLLLSRKSLVCWGGTRSSTDINQRCGYDPNSDCDYNRACEVESYIGLIDVGDQKGLVLGDIPMATTWWMPDKNDHVQGMLVRWFCADNEESVLRALADIPTDVWTPTGLTFRIFEESLCLFDSSWAGVEVKETESLSINIQPQTYSILTGCLRLNSRTELMLHGFAAT